MIYHVRTKTQWSHGPRPWEVTDSTHALQHALKMAQDLLLRGYDVQIVQKETD